VDARSLHSSSRPTYNVADLSESDESDLGIEHVTGRDLDSTVFDNNSDEELWLSSTSYRKHCRHHNRFGKVVPIEDFAYVT
jgi:hypothetical protein